MLLLARQELEELPDRVQQYFCICVLEMRSTKEIGANHLQSVAAGLVCTQLQRGGLKSFFDYRDLASVELEVDDFVWLTLASGQFLFYLPFELVFGISRALCNQVAQLKS
jgi:hypothetical protein